MTEQIERVLLKKLVPDPRNARLHNERNIQEIRKSLQELGQHRPFVVQRGSNRVIVGNGMLEAAKSLGWKDGLVLWVDDDDVTAARRALADNRTAELATWDEKMLQEILSELGDLDVEVPGFNAEEIDALCSRVLGEDEGGEEESISDSPYTRKIEAPIYEITGEKPAIRELYDRSKTDALISEIDAAKIPDEIAVFLRNAAERHTVFNFRNIAEFYAHADSQTQDLMEKSALVIIDFNKAIEYGFVKLTQEIAEQFEKDYPDER